MRHIAKYFCFGYSAFAWSRAVNEIQLVLIPLDRPRRAALTFCVERHSFLAIDLEEQKRLGFLR